MTPDGKASAGRTRAESGIYICPDHKWCPWQLAPRSAQGDLPRRILRHAPRPSRDAPRRQYGDSRVSVGNLVIAFRLMRDPSGVLLSDDLRRKARLTIADEKTNAADDTVDLYSACVSPWDLSRLITQLVLWNAALSSTRSTSAAPTTRDPPKSPEDGGRLVNARVPTCTATATTRRPGTPNLLLMATCPARCRIWGLEDDTFLMQNRRMTQSVYDTRMFLLAQP